MGWSATEHWQGERFRVFQYDIYPPFASLDKTQRLAASHWLVGIECVPQA